MYSNHIQVFTGTRNLLLADFWIQSPTPLDRKESAHIVGKMGWTNTDTVKHSVIECLQIDDAHPGHKTLVEATLPIPSWKYRQSPDGVRWDKEYWSDFALVDEAITEATAYNLAVDWALSYGFQESEVIGSIQVKVRYVENMQLASHADDPF